MARFNGSTPVFHEDEVRRSSNFLPRLIRLIFFRLRLTNNEVRDRYHEYYARTHPGMTTKPAESEININLKRVVNGTDSITFKLMHHMMTALGLDLESVSVQFRDSRTGKVYRISTEQTVENLKTEIEKEDVIGVSSLD